MEFLTQISTCYNCYCVQDKSATFCTEIMHNNMHQYCRLSQWKHNYLQTSFFGVYKLENNFFLKIWFSLWQLAILLRVIMHNHCAKSRKFVSSTAADTTIWSQRQKWHFVKQKCIYLLCIMLAWQMQSEGCVVFITQFYTRIILCRSKISIKYV